MAMEVAPVPVMQAQGEDAQDAGNETEAAEEPGDRSDESSQEGDDEEEDEEEEEYGDAELEEDLRTLVLTRDHKHRMRLTEEEWHWAWDIKEAIEANAEIDNLSDFFYAQFGIICKDNVEDALERAAALQGFRAEYSVKDTYEDGCLCIKQLFLLMPEQFLDFSFNDREGAYVFTTDSTKMDSTQLSSSNRFSAWMAATYYMQTAYCPDMDSIRKGITVVAECDGWSWTKKQDFKVFQAMFSQLVSVYPLNGHVRCYHTGVIWNVMGSILSRLLPANANSIKTGFKAESRLDQYYLVPDEATAKQRMYQQLVDTLKRRYDNERDFKLLEAPIYRRRNNGGA